MDNTTPHECVEMDRTACWEKRDGSGGRVSLTTINDSDAPDLGRGHHTAWKQPKDDTHRPRLTPNVHGFPALGSLTPAEEKRRDRAIPDSGSVGVAWNSTMESNLHSERDGGHMAPLGPTVGAPRLGMRPAGVSGPARRMAPVGVRDVKGRSAVRPLSVEVVEFSAALVPENNVKFGRKTMSSEAGGVAPAVVADPPVPTAVGMTFSAVAEVHVSASAIEDDSSVAQASEQRIVCSTDAGKVPETLSVPAGDTLVTKPMKHLAQKIDLNGIPMEEMVLEPLVLSVPDISLDSRPMAGNMNRNPLEHAGPEEDRTSRPMEGAFGPFGSEGTPGQST